MTDRGWICLYRKSLKNPLFQKPLVWHFWQYCLLKANHTDKKIIWNKKEMIIKAGSFITGRKKAAQETGLSEQNVRTAIETLVNLGMIVKSTTKSTTKFTYLTICNYNKYQEKNNKTNHQTNQQLTSNQPATNQQLTTNNNDNHYNHYNNDNKKETDRGCPYLKIIKIYHEKLPMLPRVQAISENLKKRIRSRWKEDRQRQTLEWWEWYFQGVSKCDFLVGKVKSWTASFYWLTGPENMTKVLNGEYLNRKKQSKTDQAIEAFLNGK